MFRPKNSKIAFISLVLVLGLSVGPASAKRLPKSGRNRVKTTQVKEAASDATAKQSMNTKATTPKSASPAVNKSRKVTPPRLAQSTASQTRAGIRSKPGTNKTAHQRNISAARANRSGPAIGSAHKKTAPGQHSSKPPPPPVIKRATRPSNVSKPRGPAAGTMPSAPRPNTSRKTITRGSSSIGSALKPRQANTPSSNKAAGIARRLTRVKPSTPKMTERPIEKRNRQTTLVRQSNIIGKTLQPRNAASRNHKVKNKSIIERIFGSRTAKKTENIERSTIGRAVLPKPVRNNIVNTTTVVNNNRDSVRVARRDRGTQFRRPYATSKVIYEDRTRAVRRTHHHEHVYRDRHNRLCHRIIWPRFFIRVWYDWGPRIVFHYVYPYYHRRYVFVSLGGYWPVEYSYIRYYWYPCHSYYWYGYHPIARQVHGDTYNYYTYNYYGDSTSTTDYSQAVNGITPVDGTQDPQNETLADTYFDAAVKAFENGDYDTAADRFAKAMELAPEDMILPFAYAQALFADEKYSDAAKVIRLALENTAPDQQGVFYPRGLYVDDDILFTQIDRLAERTQLCPSNTNLQLLLGYQLLGIGQIEKSLESLRQASIDTENTAAATVLLDLAEKLNAENAEKDDQ